MAFEFNRKFFGERFGERGKIFKTFRAQLCGVHQPERAVAILARLPHQFHQQPAHRVTRIDFHDWLQFHRAGGIAINKSVDAERSEKIHAAQFVFQRGENFAVKIQQPAGNIRRLGNCETTFAGIRL